MNYQLDVVIVAEGTRSQLLKQAGLREDYQPQRCLHRH